MANPAVSLVFPSYCTLNRTFSVFAINTKKNINININCFFIENGGWLRSRSPHSEVRADFESAPGPRPVNHPVYQSKKSLTHDTLGRSSGFLLARSIAR